MSRIPPAAIGLLVVALVVALAVIGWRFLAGTARNGFPPGNPAAEDNGRASEPRLPGFVDRAAAVGLNFRMKFLPDEQGERFKINLYDHGCGLAVGDYNGDGHDDIYFTNQLGGNALFRNRGDGSFDDVTDSVGPIALDDRICVSAVFNDYDNDGDQDLYVTSTRGGNALFRNDGGRFKDVTDTAGLTWFGHSQTAAFFDYDNDGLLDLFLTNSAAWTKDEYDGRQNYYPGYDGGVDVLLRRPKEYNVLFRNRGDGTFENVTEQVQLAGQGWGGDVSVFDYDEDGRLDLLVTNMFGPSRLYRNGQDGRFHDVTRDAMRVTSFGTIGAKAFDYNNDGRLDLVIGDMHSDMWMGADVGIDLRRIDPGRKYATRRGPYSRSDDIVAHTELEAEIFGTALESVVFGNTFFENLGQGRFEEISDEAGLETFWPWGVATGDFDNDGYEDVFFPSGMGYPFGYWPNHLMVNGGDGTFRDQAAVRGIEPPVGGPYLAETIGGLPAARSSRCAATGDFDSDGRLEIVTNNFNDGPYYFVNEFPRRNYLAVGLTGRTGNRDAVGAIVRCYLGNLVLTRQVHAAGGYLSQSSKILHFGLGDRDRIDRLEIHWPDGRRQTIESPSINARLDVVEM